MVRRNYRNYGFLALLFSANFGAILAIAIAVPVLLLGLTAVGLTWKNIIFPAKDTFPIWGYFVIGFIILFLYKRRGGE